MFWKGTVSEELCFLRSWDMSQLQVGAEIIQRLTVDRDDQSESDVK